MTFEFAGVGQERQGDDMDISVFSVCALDRSNPNIDSEVLYVHAIGRKRASQIRITY